MIVLFRDNRDLERIHSLIANVNVSDERNIGQGALNLEPNVGLSYSREIGGARYQELTPDNKILDSLLVTRKSDTLIVSFHGALDRKKFQLPRFERLATLLRTPFSLLFLTDPGLHYNPTVQLTWYSGPPAVDYFQILARKIREAIQTTKSENVLLSGSSGGGFAALQIAPLVENSAVLAFNPQTSIHDYVIPPHSSIWAQRNYLDAIAPELKPESIDAILEHDWTLQLGDRLSSLRRYKWAQKTRVFYATNLNDWHHEAHYLPFSEVIPNHLLTTYVYKQEGDHQPPTDDYFLDCVTRTINNLKS